MRNCSWLPWLRHSVTFLFFGVEVECVSRIDMWDDAIITLRTSGTPDHCTDEESGIHRLSTLARLEQEGVIRRIVRKGPVRAPKPPRRSPVQRRGRQGTSAPIPFPPAGSVPLG